MIPRRHTIVLVGGPNGAGKSTFIKQYVAKHSKPFVVLNADEIARANRQLSDQLAGRELLNRLAHHVAARDDIVVETTLSGVAYARRIPQLQAIGYRVLLHYLALTSVNESIARVGRRVAMGGLNIPATDLRRRFPRSVDNFERVYKPLVDAWYHYRSGADEFQMLRYFERGDP